MALAEDSQILQGILPNEVWKYVGERATRGQSASSDLINSSPYFRNLLGPQKTTILFGQVWQVLAKCVAAKAGDEQDHSNILMCREVCKTWEKNIDRWICADGYRTMEVTTLSGIETRAKEKTAQILFRNSVDTAKFLQFFNGKRAGVGRAIKIVLSDNTRKTDPPFLDDLLEFATKYGCWGVWILRLEIINDGSPPSYQFYYELCQILEKFRALRKLSVNYISPNEANDQVWKVLKYQFRNELLRKPHFPQLTAFNMMGTRNGFFSRLLKLNDHVEILIVEMVTNRVFDHRFKNLKSVRLHLTTMEDFDKMEHMNGDWPKLSWLELNRCPFVEWDDLWTVLGNKFGKSLKSLVIRLPEALHDECYTSRCFESTKVGGIGGRNFENLEFVRLKVNLRIFVDFLLPYRDTLKKLEILPGSEYRQDDLELLYYDGHDYNQIVQFQGYRANMLESNIWELFSKLEAIKVFVPVLGVTKTYTRKEREEWEEGERE